MADPYEDFNPDASLRELVSLSVVKSNGSEIAVTTGTVVLAAGANVQISVDDDTDEVELSADIGYGTEDTYWRDKYTALASLTDLNDAGNPVTGGPGSLASQPAYSFTRDSMWLATLANTPADPGSGAVFLLGDACSCVGQFEEFGYPEDVASTLSLFDICTPCMDCQTYETLNKYILRIASFYNWILDLIVNTDTAVPPPHPDGGTPETISGLLPQMMALRKYWDYLLHMSTVKFTPQCVGQAITTAVYYKNISDASIAGPVTVSTSYQFFEDGVPWPELTTDIVGYKVLTREGVGTDENVDQSPSFTISGDKTTATIYAETSGALDSGQAAYHDHALLIKSLSSLDVDKEYTIEATMTITPTHLDPITVTMTETIYFQPGNASSSGSDTP